jgi:hypothetical protein
MTDADPMHEALPLVQFVTARLGERKTVAQGWTEPHGISPEMPGAVLAVERVLAELEAIRKIVANARTALDQAWQLGEEAREASAFLAVRTLQHLAELDADHPDYDPAWQL